MHNPQVDFQKNEIFITMMEEYFAVKGEKYYKGGQIDEIRKDLN